jgi:predicted nucleic acid-binding protein
MIKDGVIVDTSVLIDFLRGEMENAEKVSRLLKDNRVVTTGIIIAELLQGLKDHKEEDKIVSLLSGLFCLEITTELWIKAGTLSLSLRRKGINLPLTDVAIAILAIKNDLSILTNDNHFKHIPKVKLI